MLQSFAFIRELTNLTSLALVVLFAPLAILNSKVSPRLILTVSPKLVFLS